MKIKKGLLKDWKQYVSKNSGDGYSYAVIEATEAVGKLLDKGKTCTEAELGMHGQGLTGFMAGHVALGIAHFHPRGEEFRAWWNAQYGVTGKKGTVNPAIMTIKT